MNAPGSQLAEEGVVHRTDQVALDPSASYVLDPIHDKVEIVPVGPGDHDVARGVRVLLGELFRELKLRGINRGTQHGPIHLGESKILQNGKRRNGVPRAESRERGAALQTLGSRQ